RQAQVHQWRIDKKGEALKIPAGSLHQLSEGAILSIVANPAAPEKDVIGYLTATKVDILQSDVAPVEYGDKKIKIAAAAIPETAWARLVNSNLTLSLRVAL